MSHSGFLEAIRERPDDDGVRLIYADWLEDHDDPTRAEFIRVQCRLARLPEWHPERPGLEQREETLLARHSPAWDGPLGRFLSAGDVARWKFERGFVERLTLPADAFLKHAEWLVECVPLRHLELWNPGGPVSARQLAACPHLGGVQTLTFLGQRYEGPAIDADGLVALGHSPHLRALTALNLSGNDLGPAGAEALVRTPLPGRLTHLDLGRNDLGDDGVRLLAGCPRFTRLRSLRLDANRITDVGIARLAGSRHLKELRALWLRENRLGADGAAALASPAFAGLTTLKLGNREGRRSADDYRVSEEGMEALVAGRFLPNLEELDLGGQRIGAQGLRRLLGALRRPALRGLNLSGNGLGTGAVRELARCPHLAGLTWLDLSENRICCVGVEYLAESPHLARLLSLNLDGNRVHGRGARALVDSRTLSRLQSLSLFENHLGDAGELLLRGEFGDRVEF